MMAMSKLTLTAPPDIITLAEQLARTENTSISAMFVNFIMAKAKLSEEPRSKQQLGPLTQSLIGIVKLPNDFDEKEFMSDVLAEKYGLDK